MEEAVESGEISKKIDIKKASERAFATAFTIREISKFKPNEDFLSNIANSFFESIGSSERISHSIRVAL